jgi:hypothetical protein
MMTAWGRGDGDRGRAADAFVVFGIGDVAEAIRRRRFNLRWSSDER